MNFVMKQTNFIIVIFSRIFKRFLPSINFFFLSPDVALIYAVHNYIETFSIHMYCCKNLICFVSFINENYSISRQIVLRFN